MKQYTLLLELQEDTIFTARSATVGAHQSLDYIPGAALYGACASTLYQTLTSEQAFSVFHSGKVRFGNGLPLSCEGEQAYPMPFAWHVKKGDDYEQQDHSHLLDGKQIINPLIEEKPEYTQLNQLRDGYITNSGQLVRPATTFRMKTAIDPYTTTAAEAQLFGYDAIEAGQTFQAWLEIDEEIPIELVEQIYACLNGVIRLGRSRSAQYGTVDCRLTEKALDKKPLVKNNQLVLLLLSDMALRDNRGLPELMPQVSHFGLDQAALEWDKSYLRFRHYSPYNAARKHYDQERQVIQKGSVISLMLDKELTETQRIKLQTGIGDYRQTGLGRVLINADLLLNRPPCPVFSESPAHAKAQEPSHHLLVKWLKSQTNVGSLRSQTRETAELLKQELEQLYKSARAYAAQPEGSIVGPGKTQWGRVSAAGKQGNDQQALLTKLKDIVKYNEQSGKVEDEVWSTTTGSGDSQANFGDWLLQQLQQETDRPGDVIALLGRFADELIRKIESRSVTTATEIN